MQYVKYHHAVMLSFFTVLEECQHINLSGTLGIQTDLLDELRTLDTHGQRLISSKAEDFLAITLNPHSLHDRIDRLAYTTVLGGTATGCIYRISMRAIINILEESPDLPERLKIETDVLYQLKRLDSAGQQKICSHASEYLFLDIDNARLQQVISFVKQQMAENTLEYEYLQRLAPHLLMRDLFGIHSRDFSQRRKFLGLANKGQHRPKACDKETEFLIWQQWKRHECLNERDRYLYIAKEHQLPINCIYAAVKSYRQIDICTQH